MSKSNNHPIWECANPRCRIKLSRSEVISSLQEKIRLSIKESLALEEMTNKLIRKERVLS